MNLDALVILFLVLFPGASGVTLWDFISRQGKAPLTHTLGWGAFLSLCMLAISSRFHLFSLDVIGPSNTINWGSILAPHFLVEYALFSISCITVAACAARVAHTTVGARIATAVLGRTLSGSSWMEIMQMATGRWLHVETINETLWQGLVTFAPEVEEGAHLGLAQPHLSRDNGKTWHRAQGLALVPISSIQFMIIHVKGKNGGQHGPQAEKQN